MIHLKEIKALVISLLMLNANFLVAQTNKAIGLDLGFSLVSVHESRFSAQTKNMVVPMFQFTHLKQSEQRREEFVMSYSGNFGGAYTTPMSFKIIHPNITYTYQRRYKDTWVGGYFNSFTLLTFPKSNINNFTNNPISYTIAQNLGLAINKDFRLIEKETKSLDLSTALQANLLSYVIRPGYGHPYPDHFLKEDTFNPTRAGLGKSIARSGKLRTLNKYQSFKVMLGMHYGISDKVNLNCLFNLSFDNNQERQNSSIKTLDLLVGFRYKY